MQKKSWQPWFGDQEMWFSPGIQRFYVEARWGMSATVLSFWWEFRHGKAICDPMWAESLRSSYIQTKIAASFINTSLISGGLVSSFTEITELPFSSHTLTQMDFCQWTTSLNERIATKLIQAGSIPLTDYGLRRTGIHEGMNGVSLTHMLSLWPHGSDMAPGGDGDKYGTLSLLATNLSPAHYPLPFIYYFQDTQRLLYSLRSLMKVCWLVCLLIPLCACTIAVIFRSCWLFTLPPQWLHTMLPVYNGLVQGYDIG